LLALSKHSGYRSFGSTEILRLLCIDLLPGSGMGLEQTRGSLNADPNDLRSALEHHAGVLRAERRRLDRILEAVESALKRPGPNLGGGGLVEQLADRPARLVGAFGRLAKPSGGVRR
jgi:DNA-binding transcriptional MerR regulator